MAHMPSKTVPPLAKEQLELQIKILVIEDEQEESNFIRLALDSEHYEVITALNGREGWEKIQQIRPDLVLLDVCLPEIDGLEICRRIKNDPTSRNTFVILMSGIRTSSDDQSFGLEVGADGYLGKPFAARELLANVKAMVRIRTREIALHQKDLELEEAHKEALSIMQDLEKSAQSLRKLSRAVEQSSATIVITNTSGDIEYANPAFETITGYNIEEVLGKNPRVLKSGMHPPEFYKDMWETLSKGNVWHGEICNKKKDGEFYWESATIAPVRNSQGQITNYVAVKDDTTESIRQKKQLQESYEQLQQLETARDSLVHMIVHDMRSPLSATSLSLQVLDKYEMKNISEKNRKLLHQATLSIKKLIQMVNNLLDISKMESEQMKLSLADCDLVKVVQKVVSEYESLKEQRQFIVDLPTTAVQVVCDPDLISRVIQNLFTNALKFTPKNGTIRVVIQSTEDSVQVSIKDTGPGIPSQYLKKIFDKFFQVEAREYSTGLGLTFCKLAIETHGGQIGVDSEVDKGSTFWFILPKKKIA
jgi:PAS domain S-box-containing protein